MSEISSDIFERGSDTSSGSPISEESITGVLAITIQSGQIFRRRYCCFLRAPNPFVVIRLKDSDSNACLTTYRRRTYGPNWIKQTKYLVVGPQDLNVFISLLSFHQFLRCNRLIGTASLSIAGSDSTQATTTCISIKRWGYETAELLVTKAIYYPTTNSPLKSVLSGIVRLVLHQAASLNSSDATPPKFLNPLAEVRVIRSNQEKPLVFETQGCAETDAPVWLSECVFFCDDRVRTRVTVDVVDMQGRKPVSTLGSLSIPVDDLLRQGPEPHWWPLMGSTAGRVKMSVKWIEVDVCPTSAI